MKLKSIISDGMVLQANKPIFIGGYGAGIVSISFCGRKYSKKILGNDSCEWFIKIDSMDYGGPFEMIVNLNGDHKTITNIMIGEVYICAGQSNMQFSINDENKSYEFSNNNMIRCYVQDRREEYIGFKSKDGWCNLENTTAGFWSSIAINIAVNMYDLKHVAIGIIGIYQGASNIQSWIGERWFDKEIILPKENMHPDAVAYPLWNNDSYLYNYTFKKIVPYSSACVIWYQGESNTSLCEVEIYDKLLIHFVSCWRDDLQDDELPFIIIQICNYKDRKDDGWKGIQTVQGNVEKFITNSVCVKCSDILSDEDIHPMCKDILAKRIVETIKSRLSL